MEAFRAWLDAERGRQFRLAEALGISSVAIYYWRAVPIERLEQVSQFTGIPPEQLRPDIARIFKDSGEGGEAA